MADEGAPDGPAPEPDAALSAGFPEAGLCDRCRHAEVVTSKRSRYLRCRLADVDPRFDKYPRLPIVRCAGFAGFSPLPGA